jgi:hypothetical protein
MHGLSLTTTLEGNPAPAITVTSTDGGANTIGNQLKLADLAIRVSGFGGRRLIPDGICIGRLGARDRQCQPARTTSSRQQRRRADRERSFAGPSSARVAAS